jgi:hypothetical protein
MFVISLSFVRTVSIYLVILIFAIQYTMLVALIKEVGVDRLQERDSKIFSSVIEPMDHVGLVGRVADFVEAWMQYVRINNLSGAHMDTYFELMRCGLLNENYLIRKHFAVHLLKPMLSNEPHLYERMATYLSIQAKGSQHELEATISLERVARFVQIYGSLKFSGLESKFHLACNHQSSALRLDVLGLVSDYRKSCAPLSDVDLSILKQFLNSNCTDSSPEFRQSMYAKFIKIFERMRNSAYVLQRSAKSEQSTSQLSLDRYQECLQWILDYIFIWFYPRGAYPRITTCLLVLDALIQGFGVHEVPLPNSAYSPSTKDRQHFPFRLQIDTASHRKSIVSLLHSPYEDIQRKVHDLLLHFQFSTKEEINDLCRLRDFFMARSHAQDAHAGAILQHIIYRSSCPINESPEMLHNQGASRFSCCAYLMQDIFRDYSNLRRFNFMIVQKCF